MTATAPPADHGQSGERRRDIDLLRTLMVFGLVFFHTARIFDALPLPEGIKNEPTSLVATVVTAFFALWAMPLMFAMSGVALRNSLGKRTPGAFVRERLQRLLVPFLFGVLLVIPPQYYLHELGTDPANAGSYWQFLARFFDVRPCWRFPIPLCPTPRGLFQVAHLWFLWDLLLFSILLLPVFLWLQRPRAQRAIDWLARVSTRPGAALLWGLPLALIDAALVLTGNDYGGGWAHTMFALFLLCGYLVGTDRRLSQALGRSWRAGVIVAPLAVLAFVAGLYWLIEVRHVDPVNSYDWASVLWRGLKSVGAWAWIVAILGFGARPRQGRAPKAARTPRPTVAERRPGLIGRAVAYAGEAFLPFYVMHQTAVFAIGYVVVRWQIPASLKLVVISLAALVGTLVVYELAVRRWRVMRWLLGMRPAKGDR